MYLSHGIIHSLTAVGALHPFDDSQGTKLKLPLRKNREGKMLGRATPGDENDDHDVAEREAFVLRAADPAESRAFRALFSTEEDDKLAPASLFAGQVNH